ncbi:putative exostosin [Helianthus annuus]|nr:putative exostosin [Helianthus annuus]KAJ0656795.1 putative exostosin [Helianthus annuus]KAJ0660391.1 putative exostosin [Helianthus annuus]
MFTFNKTIIHSIHSHITSHPLISLFILTLFLIEITLFCSHSPPPQPLFPPTDNLCTDGTIYVYDLPPMFNSEALLGSEFCLQPRGDSFTRRSVFDCMIAGSVPVLFWNRTMYDQYEWYMPEEPESYSVFIDHGDVSAGKRSIKAVLESYSVEKVRRMREKVIEIIPKIVYSNSNSSSSSNDGMKDAFEIAVEGVLKRFGAEREQLRLESVGKGFLESP